MQALLQHLLTASPSPQPVADIHAWWQRHHAAAAAFSVPIERAIAGGFAADRLGYAFASGYTEALRQLFGQAGPEPLSDPAALCATEEGGAHPRAIATSLTLAAERDGGWELSGHKQLVTFGSLARVLFVVAAEGRGIDEPGRNRLAVVRIPADRAGVTIRPQPELPFVSEIPHATVELARVRVAAGERLPGDGYERYLKPFRTVEDCHVLGAVLSWLTQVARRSAWPQPLVQKLLMLIVAGQGLAAVPPLEPALHVALGGWLECIERLVSDCEPLWAQAEPETRSRWERDRPLLRIAGRVRSQRLASAWQRLG